MPKSHILTEVPPISPQDIFALFDRRKEHFDYPVHVHDVYELNFITGAAGAVRVVGDSVETIGDKELVLITGNKLEHAWIDGDCKFDREVKEVTIQFSPDLFSDNGLLSRKQFASMRKMFQVAHNGMSFSAETIDQAEEEIRKLTSSGGDFRSVLTFLSLLDVLAHDKNAKVLSHVQFSQVEEAYDSRRVKKFMEYLSSNYQRKIKLSEVAELLNMSEPSFTRFIKKRTGFSFVDCLNNIRVSAASRILIDEPATTIAEIAYRCGFNNLSNFNRIFRSRKDCTPHEFREYYRKNKIII